jgi:tRNA/rRNA methyltransferase
MIQIIFLEPSHPGNIGAIARSMKNFGLDKLVLIDPRCKIDQEAKNRAKHAQEVLKNAKTFKSLLHMREKLKLDYLVGTTAAMGRDYNIPRIPITPEQFAMKAKEIGDRLNIGLIIGREGDGLTNEEILECDFVVSIPAYKEYPTLNASHAASIIFYELFKHLSIKSKNQVGHIKLATEKDKEILMKEINDKIKNIKFATESKRETQRRLWKRLIGKSFLSKREAQALIGFLKKL